jgi:GH25 family lysozyme M1 (1,4-beta-N-acetylmuramidase)
MALNGIDIASWQAGIDVAQVPCDFVIAKATQGIGYVNPDCARAVDQALGAGRLAGVYHYVAGGNAIGEADYFVDNIKGWVGRAVLAIDWESNQNAAWGDTGYLEQVVRRVIQRTGIKPLIYASSSSYPWDVAKKLDCGAWVAQYASMAATGYQDAPWNEGAYSCAMRQYSSNGRLNGWNAGLDLDKFYGDRAAWARYASANGKPAAPAPAPAPAKPAASPAGTYTVRAGDTLSGIAAAHNTTWQRLQQINNIPNPNLIHPGQSIRLDGAAPAKPASAPAATYTVRPGDNLSAIAAAHHTTWQALAAKNHISNPNLIHPGQIITL